MLCAAVKVCVQQGVAMVPRGGGASYTDGYLLAGEDHVLIDTCALDMIEIDEANALVRVGAGVTWATLRAALAAKGLRTPFWGPLLVTDDNFGCGSSREQAPWALADLGVRVLITTGFDEIFQSNCFNNGMLPIVLADHDVALLDAAAKAGEPFTVDLEAQQIRLPTGTFAFTVEPARREALRNGWDEIARIRVGFGSAIATFERQQRTQAPWLWTAEQGLQNG